MGTYLERLSETTDSPTFKEEIAELFKEMVRPEAFVHEAKDMRLLRRKDLKEFNQLTEDDILRLTKEWRTDFREPQPSGTTS